MYGVKVSVYVPLPRNATRLPIESEVQQLSATAGTPSGPITPYRYDTPSASGTVGVASIDMLRSVGAAAGLITAGWPLSSVIVIEIAACAAAGAHTVAAAAATAAISILLDFIVPPGDSRA